jgi:hypothetical protein
MRKSIAFAPPYEAVAVTEAPLDTTPTGEREKPHHLARAAENYDFAAVLDDDGFVELASHGIGNHTRFAKTGALVVRRYVTLRVVSPKCKI